MVGVYGSQDNGRQRTCCNALFLRIQEEQLTISLNLDYRLDKKDHSTLKMAMKYPQIAVCTVWIQHVVEHSRPVYTTISVWTKPGSFLFEL